MSTITITRRIDLTALPFPASERWDGTTAEITAEVPEADLRTAIDAAPAFVPDDPAAARAAFRDAVAKATTIAALKDAILGTTTGVEPEVRPGR